MKESTNTKIAQSNLSRVPLNPTARIPLNHMSRLSYNPTTRLPINPMMRMSGTSDRFIEKLTRIKNTESKWNVKGYTKNIKT